MQLVKRKKQEGGGKKSKFGLAGSEVLTAVTIKSAVLWVVTPYSLETA
jgi:arginine decarboxylase-like protein